MDVESSSEAEASRPNAARMYDYFLGGSEHVAVDREAAGRILEVFPGCTCYLRNNRAFLRRAVHHVAAAGVAQFLDLGSGLPTAGTVHEIAQHHDPRARVSYVDFDPVVVRRTRELLGPSEGRATITREDVRDPERVLNAPGVAGLLDFDRPVALLVVGVLPFLHDTERTRALLARYLDALAPGSYLGWSHIAALDRTAAELDTALQVLSDTATPERSRTLDECRALLPAGLTWTDPGIVPAAQWRPEHPASASEISASNCYVALGRKQ